MRPPNKICRFFQVGEGALIYDYTIKRVFKSGGLEQEMKKREGFGAAPRKTFVSS
jgi:hypothetical protein